MQEIQITQSTLEEAYAVSLLIPEFEPWYPWEKWEERCRGRNLVALVAKVNGELAGCKVGYFEQDHFYSWVGGVIPAYRGIGIATKLAESQEKFVRDTGVKVIRMKTRNRFTEMLQMALSRGFYITDVEQKGKPLDWRIVLYKNL